MRKMTWGDPVIRHPGTYDAWVNWIARSSDGTTVAYQYLPYFDEHTGKFRDYNGLPGKQEVIPDIGLPLCGISRIDEPE